jgi:hypothetical protein
MRCCVWSRNLVYEEAQAHWGGGAVAPKTKKQTNMYVWYAGIENVVPRLPKERYFVIWRKDGGRCLEDVVSVDGV